jgi:integrase/recombinase XerC
MTITTASRPRAPRQAPPGPVAEHLKWLALRGLPEATTIAERRRVLLTVHRHLRMPLLDADAADLMGWRESIRHLSDASVNSYVSHLTAFYTWAASRGLVEDNPAASLPRPHIPRRLPRPIPTADLFRALEQAPQPLRLWLVLAAWCGLRCKEIARLRRDCIREQDQPPVLLIAGDATKGRHERIVPLAPFAVTEIRAAGLPASGWAFRRADGRPGPNTPTRVSQITNDYLHSLGIAATMHTLRHWFGTQSYATSHDLRAVQELMGHSSPEITAGYAAWANAAAREITSALPVPPAGLTPEGWPG